jgi:hypothetical protein
LELSYHHSTEAGTRHHAAEACEVLHSHLYPPDTLLVVPNVNGSRLEPPGGNFTAEQDVSFAVRAMLELRKEKVNHNPADGSGTSPDVISLACEIPPGRVQHP